MIITLLFVLMWNDKSLSNLLYFPNFCSVIDRQHLCHLKSPCCDSWDIQGQSLSRGFKAFSCTILFTRSWCSHLLGNFLVACICAWRVLFLGSSIVLQFHNWSSKFWKSTVLDSAKPFGWICFFCYIALSILSPWVHLKERVVAI